MDNTCLISTLRGLAIVTAKPWVSQVAGAWLHTQERFWDESCWKLCFIHWHREKSTGDAADFLPKQVFFEKLPGSVELQPGLSAGSVFAGGAPCLKSSCYHNFLLWEWEGSTLIWIKLEVWISGCPWGSLCVLSESYSVLQFRFSLSTSVLCSA